MADSPIRTIRGQGGVQGLRAVRLEATKAPDGSFVVEGLGGQIRGTGPTLEVAIEQAQAAQQQFVKTDSMGGKGFRTVTAGELGIAEP